MEPIAPRNYALERVVRDSRERAGRAAPGPLNPDVEWH
jgi:hypothetical protein